MQLSTVLELDPDELRALLPKRRLKKVETDPTTLGGFLAARRLELGLTQREVAERADSNHVSISQFERGAWQPTSSTLDRIAQALECEVPTALRPPHREGNRTKQAESHAALSMFLKTRRIELGLSQQQVASRAHSSQGWVSLIERGVRPGGATLAKLERALDCKIPVELLQ